MIHTLNKAKIEAELHKRGWNRGIYGVWITPLGSTDKSMEIDWTQAILKGIECELEQQKKETEEFLKKHPTHTRHM